MPAVDRWVVHQAVRLLANIDPALRLEVNVSGESMADEDAHAARSTTELAETGVDPARLMLEVVEQTAVANIEETRRFAQQVQAPGLRVRARRLRRRVRLVLLPQVPAVRLPEDRRRLHPLAAGKPHRPARRAGGRRHRARARASGRSPSSWATTTRSRCSRTAAWTSPRATTWAARGRRTSSIGALTPSARFFFGACARPAAVRVRLAGVGLRARPAAPGRPRAPRARHARSPRAAPRAPGHGIASPVCHAGPRPPGQRPRKSSPSAPNQKSWRICTPSGITSRTPTKMPRMPMKRLRRPCAHRVQRDHDHREGERDRAAEADALQGRRELVLDVVLGGLLEIPLAARCSGKKLSAMSISSSWRRTVITASVTLPSTTSTAAAGISPRLAVARRSVQVEQRGDQQQEPECLQHTGDDEVAWLAVGGLEQPVRAALVVAEGDRQVDAGRNAINAAPKEATAAGLPARSSQASCSSCDIVLALGLGRRLGLVRRARRVVVRVVGLDEARQPLAGGEHEVEPGRGQPDERLEALAGAQLVRCELCAISGKVSRSAIGRAGRSGAWQRSRTLRGACCPASVPIRFPIPGTTTRLPRSNPLIAARAQSSALIQTKSGVDAAAIEALRAGR